MGSSISWLYSTKLTKSSVRQIIVHCCASNNTSVTNRTEIEHQKWLQGYFINELKYCDMGYHFIIGKNGTIFEGNPIGKVGYHAGDRNAYTIGVSAHGDYDTRTFTSPQENRMVNLLAWLCYYFNIHPSNIIAHNTFSPKTCLWKNIDSRLQAMRAAVFTRLYPGVQQ